jgi:Pyruvate/2-oxoacid:ferredoxin oxidoreductase delta subunit
LLGAVGAWFWNERQKRVADQYQRKEAKYKELIHSLRGFYVGTPEAKRLRSEFLEQLNQCWLYCPDDIIQKGYAFLATVHTGPVQSDEVAQKALGDFIAAIRQDLLSDAVVQSAKLTGSAFRHLRAID